MKGLGPSILPIKTVTWWGQDDYEEGCGKVFFQRCAWMDSRGSREGWRQEEMRKDLWLM